MDGLTIHEASLVTGWSARMLRYIEDSGLVVPARSAGGYRLFGPAELQRLRTLRDLLEEHEVELAEVGFALRLRSDPSLRSAVDAWLSAEAERPSEVDPAEWLAFEQEKHLRLLSEMRGLAETSGASPAGPARLASRPGLAPQRTVGYPHTVPSEPSAATSSRLASAASLLTPSGLASPRTSASEPNPASR